MNSYMKSYEWMKGTIGYRYIEHLVGNYPKINKYDNGVIKLDLDTYKNNIVCIFTENYGHEKWSNFHGQLITTKEYEKKYCIDCRYMGGRWAQYIVHIGDIITILDKNSELKAWQVKGFGWDYEISSGYGFLDVPCPFAVCEPVTPNENLRQVIIENNVRDYPHYYSKNKARRKTK